MAESAWMGPREPVKRQDDHGNQPFGLELGRAVILITVHTSSQQSAARVGG
jgi:hypothetical protein